MSFIDLFSCTMANRITFSAHFFPPPTYDAISTCFGLKSLNQGVRDQRMLTPAFTKHIMLCSVLANGKKGLLTKTEKMQLVAERPMTDSIDWFQTFLALRSCIRPWVWYYAVKWALWTRCCWKCDPSMVQHEQTGHNTSVSNTAQITAGSLEIQSCLRNALDKSENMILQRHTQGQPAT